MLPLKTTIADLDALTGYLKTQVGWVAVDKVKKAIPTRHADNRKLEAMRYIGMIERDGSKIKLTEAGRGYSSAADDDSRADIIRSLIRPISLYHQTAEWMHFSSKDAPTKTEVANYWHDSHTDELQGASGAALTDAVIFFLRLMSAAGLGQYVGAGNNRPETYLKVNTEALEQYVTTEEPIRETPTTADPEQGRAASDSSSSPAVPNQVDVTSNPAVHVNVEIHIAADAQPGTIEGIFKNMRKYVLNLPPTEDE